MKGAGEWANPKFALTLFGVSGFFSQQLVVTDAATASARRIERLDAWERNSTANAAPSQRHRSHSDEWHERERRCCS